MVHYIAAEQQNDFFINKYIMVGMAADLLSFLITMVVKKEVFFLLNVLFFYTSLHGSGYCSKFYKKWPVKLH